MPAPPALAIVLAAGKGTRMKSRAAQGARAGGRAADGAVRARRPAGGRRRAAWSSSWATGPNWCGRSSADVPGVEFADQTEQLGTGHAVMMCRDAACRASRAGRGRGGRFADAAGRVGRDAAGGVRPPRRRLPAGNGRPRRIPTGYGRIVRDAAGEFAGIVEEKDATPEQRAIREVNVSTYVFDAAGAAVGARPITGGQLAAGVLHYGLPGIAAGRGQARRGARRCSSRAKR